MNREVHYIFSIQTKDYLKKQDHVYLIVNEIKPGWGQHSYFMPDSVFKCLWIKQQLLKAEMLKCNYW